MYQVLLVEDSPTQTIRITSLLEETGHHVEAATNGLEALDRLQDYTPDAIVTDLQMPEMNGLDLISRLQNDHPLLPSILITEHGSERLAIDALSLGAASYVAKSHADHLLPEVTKFVSKLCIANLQTLPLKGTFSNHRLTYVIDGRVARIEPLACLIMRQMTAMNLLHSLDRMRVCVALEYLLFHFVYHGCLEQPIEANPVSRQAANAVINDMDQDQANELLNHQVTCDMIVDKAELRFVVSREIPGPIVSPSSLPGTPESFEDEQGRGMLLLTSIMDKVVFDRSGSSATLTKYFSSKY